MKLRTNKLLAAGFFTFLAIAIMSCSSGFFGSIEELREKARTENTKPGASGPSYTVRVAVSGNVGADSVSVTPEEGVNGDTITINYTVANANNVNRLTFSGVGASITSVNSAGTGSRSYVLNAGDQMDGVITINATFTHAEAVESIQSTSA